MLPCGWGHSLFFSSSSVQCPRLSLVGGRGGGFTLTGALTLCPEKPMSEGSGGVTSLYVQTWPLPFRSSGYVLCKFYWSHYIPLTNRVRGPYRKLRTEFFPPRFMAQARSARAINRRGKKRKKQFCNRINFKFQRAVQESTAKLTNHIARTN